MADQEKMIELRTYEGGAIQMTDIAGVNLSITPQSQALSLRWPNGGFVWNRPVAVRVEKDGQVERVPIVDITRLAQVILWGLSGLFALGTVLFAVRNQGKEGKNE